MNGFVLPFISVFIVIVVNDPELMGSSKINGWISNIFGSERKVALLTLKIRIPDIHAALPEPAKYGNQPGEHHKVIDMYPTFIAATEEIGSQPPSPGDIVVFDFANTLYSGQKRSKVLVLIAYSLMSQHIASEILSCLLEFIRQTLAVSGLIIYQEHFLDTQLLHREYGRGGPLDIIGGTCPEERLMSHPGYFGIC